MDDAIKELEADVRRLRQQLDAALYMLHDAILAAAGVKVGDIVISTTAHPKTAGKEFRVTSIEVARAGRAVYVYGNMRKRDGTFGTSERGLANYWKLAEPL